MGKDKQRILFIESFLVRHSTDKKSFTVKEIVEACLERGLSTTETTVRDDLKWLEEFNRPTRYLINEGGSTKQGKNNNPASYYVSAYFFKGEIKTLIDAVSSSFCLTYPKSAYIIDKLAGLVAEEDRESLLGMTLFDGRVRSDNGESDIIMERICDAWERKMKITFQYWDYTPERKKALRHDGLWYKVSPYALIRDDDRSYLVGYCDHKSMIANFRIDRMVNASVTEEAGIEYPAFDPADYYNHTFKMYDGDTLETDVTLLVENRLMKDLVDRFGEDFPFARTDEGHFEAKVTVYPSYTFFAWVFQYCGGIRITGPAEVAERYREMLEEALSAQGCR